MTDDAGPPPWVSDEPAWDEESAEALLGACVVIGITTLDANGALVSQIQMHGRVTIADPERGICVELAGARSGDTYWLPPQPGAFHPAAPGDYRLRSTGEVITNPDYTTSWTINQPAKS